MNFKDMIFWNGLVEFGNWFFPVYAFTSFMATISFVQSAFNDNSAPTIKQSVIFLHFLELFLKDTNFFWVPP